MQDIDSMGDVNSDIMESSDRIDTVTGSIFKAVVLDGAGPIAVEFMSYGCSFCQAIEPVLQQVADMVSSKERILRVNVEVDPELANNYKIDGTPTLVMFMNGRQVGKITGLRPTVSSVLTAVTQPFKS